MPPPAAPSRLLAVTAWAGAVWMAVFAVVHLYWSLGGTALLPAGLTVADHLPLLIIDIVAVPLSVAGAVVAMSLIRPWPRALPVRWRTWAAAAIAVLALVHSAPTVVLELVRWVGLRHADLTEADRLSAWVYEPWWFLGGVLFALSAAAHARAR